MAKRKKYEWVKSIEGLEGALGFACERCEARLIMTTPVSMEDYARYAGVFERRHKRCETRTDTDKHGLTRTNTDDEFYEQVVQYMKAEHKTNETLYEQAVRLVLTEQRCSVSMLQRWLGIGYARGSCLINRMVSDGLLARYDPLRGYRQKVLMTLEQWEARKR